MKTILYISLLMTFSLTTLASNTWITCNIVRSGGDGAGKVLFKVYNCTSVIDTVDPKEYDNSWFQLSSNQRKLGSKVIQSAISSKKTVKIMVNTDTKSLYKIADALYINAEASSNNPIYVTFYSHNEAGEPWASIPSSKTEYLEYRKHLVERVNLLKQYGATLNWETEMPVLRAMENFELTASSTVLATTNNKNILRWLTEDMGMIIDPHIHPVDEYNLADIAYKVENVFKARVSNVVGGIAVMECVGDGSYKYSNNWLKNAGTSKAYGIMDNGDIKAVNYNYTWNAKIIQGPAMGGHVFDDFSTGVWRPSANDYSVIDSSSHFISLGQGHPHTKSLSGDPANRTLYDKADYVKELANKAKEGKFSKDEILTASIHLRDTTTVTVNSTNTNTLEGLKIVLEDLKPLVESGQVIYKDYEAVANIWQTDYKAKDHRYTIDTFSIFDSLMADVTKECTRK